MLRLGCLRYYGLRYYNPNLGRWISRDPIREEFFLWDLVRRGSAMFGPFSWLNSSAYYGGDHQFAYNNSVGTYDILGLVPPPTYPDWGGEPPWPPYIELPSRGNCWRYVCNDPRGPGQEEDDPIIENPGKPIMDPGGITVVWTCDLLMNGAIIIILDMTSILGKVHTIKYSISHTPPIYPFPIQL